MVSLTLFRWIVIYPMDSAIPLLNNWCSSVKVDQESLTKKLNAFNKLIPRLKKNRERPSSINNTKKCKQGKNFFNKYIYNSSANSNAVSYLLAG